MPERLTPAESGDEPLFPEEMVNIRMTHEAGDLTEAARQFVSHTPSLINASLQPHVNQVTFSVPVAREAGVTLPAVSPQRRLTRAQGSALPKSWSRMNAGEGTGIHVQAARNAEDMAAATPKAAPPQQSTVVIEELDEESDDSLEHTQDVLERDHREGISPDAEVREAPPNHAVHGKDFEDAQFPEVEGRQVGLYGRWRKPTAVHPGRRPPTMPHNLTVGDYRDMHPLDRPDGHRRPDLQVGDFGRFRRGEMVTYKSPPGAAAGRCGNMPRRAGYMGPCFRSSTRCFSPQAWWK